MEFYLIFSEFTTNLFQVSSPLALVVENNNGMHRGKKALDCSYSILNPQNLNVILEFISTAHA